MMNTFEQIYEIVQQVPQGKVISYGQIANLLNKRISAQLVGWAMRKAPKNCPAYRVVYNDGSLAREEVFGGQDIQRQMLEAEGVTFIGDKIDMSKHAVFNY